MRQVGAEVHDFEVGDHVLTSFIPACGKCKWCARGLQNLCDAGARTLIGDQPGGGFRAHADGSDIATMASLGTFAEWQVYDQISLVKVDKSLPLNTICLVACGVQTGFGSATNAAAVRPGDVVLVLGAGGVGMNAVQGASLSGASHVVVVDPAPSKRPGRRSSAPPRSSTTSPRRMSSSSPSPTARARTRRSSPSAW